MMQSDIHYFDHNATTPLASEVVQEMLPFLTSMWANPSSPYRLGREVAEKVEVARQRVAAFINADPDEIVFTSGGTESNNAAIQATLLANPTKRHVITTAVEHAATLNFCETLVKRGYEVTFISVDADGLVDLSEIEKAIRPDTAVVSVIWANNETGVISPVGQIGTLCGSRGVLFHSDAVQAAGKVPLDVRALNVDFLSLSAHKLYGPKGIGALFIRKGVKFWPYVVGGGQEKGRRGGTENVANIVGFGRAAQLSASQFSAIYARVRTLRDKLESSLLKVVPGSICNGIRAPRLPNTSNLSFDSVEASAVVMMLDNINVYASTGAACSSGSLSPSHVLTAMGVPSERAHGSIRFSLGNSNTDSDVDYIVGKLPQIVATLRRCSVPRS